MNNQHITLRLHLLCSLHVAFITINLKAVTTTKIFKVFSCILAFRTVVVCSIVLLLLLLLCEHTASATRFTFFLFRFSITFITRDRIAIDTTGVPGLSCPITSFAIAFCDTCSFAFLARRCWRWRWWQRRRRQWKLWFGLWDLRVGLGFDRSLSTCGCRIALNFGLCRSTCFCRISCGFYHLLLVWLVTTIFLFSASCSRLHCTFLGKGMIVAAAVVVICRIGSRGININIICGYHKIARSF